MVLTKPELVLANIPPETFSEVTSDILTLLLFVMCSEDLTQIDWHTNDRDNIEKYQSMSSVYQWMFDGELHSFESLDLRSLDCVYELPDELRNWRAIQYSVIPCNAKGHDRSNCYFSSSHDGLICNRT